MIDSETAVSHEPRGGENSKVTNHSKMTGIMRNDYDLGDVSQSGC
jgi:hypothetical protein